jgi:hypothetical protein
MKSPRIWNNLPPARVYIFRQSRAWCGDADCQR